FPCSAISCAELIALSIASLLCTRSDGGVRPPRSDESISATSERRSRIAPFAVVHELSAQRHFSSARRACVSTRERKSSHALVSYGGFAKRPTPDPQVSPAVAAAEAQSAPGE